MLVHQEPIRESVVEAADSLCCHHWIIEPASEPISRGECRNCLESREFKNSIVDLDRDFRDFSSPAGPGSAVGISALEE